MASPAPITSPRPRPEAAAPEAERRQLTVMFCDLVEATALSERLDPEDLREVIGAYQSCCTAVVTRFGGRVAKYMGDGMLVYFGFPQADEHDAERAVRAGLGIVEAVRALAPRPDVALQVRVGIATGLVVVGDLIGTGGALEHAVVGETPNLAARLQTLAAPNSVVISSSTCRLIGGLFDCVGLGARRLKGFADEVPVWQVAGESRAESRFEALRATGLTPLVGRDEEIALLLERWQKAKEQEGQVVLLSGEAGIGKSRILDALRDRLRNEPYTRLRYFCSPYHQNTAFHPFIDQLERAAGLARDEPPQEKLSKLEALLGLTGPEAEAAMPLFAALLSIPTSDRYPALDLDPQRQKERTLKVLCEQLAVLTERQPVLFLMEDAHWIDPTSQDLLDLLIDRVQRLPVLMIITFRPDFRPAWTGYPHVTSLTLNRLSRRQAVAIVERVAGKPLPTEVLEQIVARSDGIPLFIEELSKTVLESGLLQDEGTHYALTGPLPPLAIPTTLQDSLMARLDRLATVKEVAQIGATIGREFPHALLAAVSPVRENDLVDALAQLVEAGLIFRRGWPPQATYIFKHALVQDAAYNSLLRARRQQLHARIAQIIEERFPETAELEPEILAHHFTRSGLHEKAVGYWCKAGHRALGRSATAEAIAHLSKGLELVAGLPDTPATWQHELALQSALGGALTAAKGFAAPETGAAYARARKLGERLGETTHLFAVLYGLLLFHLYRAEMAAAWEVAERLLRLAEESGYEAGIFFAHRAAGVSALPLGRLAEARAHLERALALHRPAHHSTPLMLYAFDPLVVCLDYLARTLLPLGFPVQAAASCDRALAEARRRRHRNTLALSLFFGAMVHQLLGNRQIVETRTVELVSLAAEEAFPIWLAGGTILQGWLKATGDETEAGIEQMRRGLTAWRATGAEYLVPYFLALMADRCLAGGQTTAARDLVSEALDRVERTSERWFEAEMHRLRGRIALAQPGSDPTTAEAAFQRAIGVARSQEALLWELRAALDLSRLWQRGGRRQEVRDLLGSIVGRFTEGPDLPDRVEAAALIEP